MAIAVLSRGKCGLSACISRYLVSMSAADLLVVLTSVVLSRIIGVYFPASFLSITPLCRLKTVLIYAARDSSVWLTVAFTFDRFVAICCQNMRNKYCRKDTAGVVVGIVCALSCVRNIPWYFAFKPLYIVDNTPWYCIFISNYFASKQWGAFSFLNHTLTLFVPLILISLFNVLTVKHILVANRIRKALRSKKGGETETDTEIENRRKSIVLLLTISGSFVLLWATYAAHYLYTRVANANDRTGNSDPVYIVQEAGYILVLLSCSTNTFIYTIIQTKFRNEVKTLMECPLVLIAQMFKQRE
ncbi:G-protein coupled receptor 15-like [Rhinoraja longicauda]